MVAIRLGHTLPARSITSAWILVFPALIHAIGVLGNLHTNPEAAAEGGWAEYAGAHAAGYLAAAVLLASAHVIGFARFHPVVGWLTGLGLIALMGMLQWWVSASLLEFMGVPTSGGVTLGVLPAVTGWVIVGVLAWVMVGRIDSQRTRLRALRSLGSQLGAMEQSDRVRLEGALRGLLNSVGKQVNRVVTDMTLESPLDDAQRARSLPHPDDDVVAPLTRRVSRNWAPRGADNQPQRRRSPLHTLAAIGPPNPLALGVFIVAGALLSARVDSASQVAALGLAAVLVSGLAAVAWWFVTRHVDILAQRLIATGVSTVAIIALAATLPLLSVTSLASPVRLIWSDALVLGIGVIGIVGGDALARSLRTQRLTTARDVAEQSTRCDELARKVGVIHHVEPRVLYSATLGTLIRTTVDLTATEVTVDRRNGALEEMAAKITNELDNLRITLMPLPEEHILSVLGMWRAAVGVDPVAGSRVFSRISWAPEGISALRETLAGAMVWAREQTASLPNLRLDSDGTQVSLEVDIPHIAPWLTTPLPRVANEHDTARWSVSRAPETTPQKHQKQDSTSRAAAGSVLRIVLTPHASQLVTPAPGSVATAPRIPPRVSQPVDQVVAASEPVA